MVLNARYTMVSVAGSHFTFFSRRKLSTAIMIATASSKARFTLQRGCSRLRAESMKFFIWSAPEG